MKLNDRIDGDHPQRSANAPHPDDFGPQGAALILELQRLRHAFEEESRSAPKPRPAPRRGNKRDQRRRAGPAKRPRKSRVSRVVDVCLQQMGLKAPPEIERRPRPSPPPDAQPPGAPEMTPAPHDSLTMNLTGLAPEVTGPLDLKPTIGLLSPDPAKPDTRLGRVVAACRTGVMRGVHFVVHAEDAPSPVDANLSLKTNWSLRHELRSGLRILLVAGVIGGGWSIFVPLAGAVVVPGNLVVQSNVKTIQHPTGGVVAEIKVGDGSHVSAGDLLMRLDATQAQASQQMVSKQLDEMRARIARLTAERDAHAQVEFPDALTARADDETVRSLLASERSLFKARLGSRQSQKDLLQSRVAQLTEEISGLETQVGARAKQLELIQGELTGVQDLYDKHLVPLTRLTALQREAARIDGERGQLISSIAETKSKIGEAQLQIVRIDQDFRTDVVKELGDVQGKESELVERSVAARDLLDRIEIRSPTSGVIHQLAAHTIGGVVKAGETIMEIVPDTDDLQVEARLQPQDIDHVHAGQQAFVRFSAFNQRTTPQLAGTVSYVSADTSRDQQTNAPYFTVRITMPDDERRRLAGQQLVPGMPAEVFMQTGSRTMMSYLFKPIVDQMRRAFVEQ